MKKHIVISTLMLTIITVIILLYKSKTFNEINNSFIKKTDYFNKLTYFMDNSTSNDTDDQNLSEIVWSNTPNVTLICRLYSGSVLEFYNIFIVGYFLFWPHKTWVNSKVVVVLDAESEQDHRLGTILANLPPHPEVFFEEYKENTFCSNWKREGYSRQQYSNFYSDNYTNSEYIGIVDSDSFFATPVTPEDLFIENKPRIHGYNGCCTGWQLALDEAIGGYHVGEFMIALGFPVLIKRTHFADIRNHIQKRMRTNSFEEAFKKICTKYPNEYSQFDLLVHYLWHFKRDEYTWHLNNALNSKHGAFTKLMSEKQEVLDANKPIVGLMKHGNHQVYSSKIFNVIYDYVCLGSKMKAGDCRQYGRDDIVDGTIKNLFVDWTFETAYWKERGLEPVHGPIREVPWSTDEVVYLDAYNMHQTKLKNRNETLVWKWKKIRSQ